MDFRQQVFRQVETLKLRNVEKKPADIRENIVREIKLHERTVHVE